MPPPALAVRRSAASNASAAENDAGVVDPTSAMDYVALSMAGIAMFALLLAVALLCIKRKHPVIRAKLAPLLILLSVGGFCHTLGAVVTNQHLPQLMLVEQRSCVVFGFFLQYACGLGVWFTANFLLIWVRNSAMSILCSAEGAAMARQSWWIIVLATMGPILLFLSLAAFLDGSHYDAARGECVSELWVKICVLVWVCGCTLALIVSVIVFWKTTPAQIAYEFRPVALVVVIGLVAAGTNAYITLTGGLDNAWGRSIATFSIAWMYLFSVGINALAPLWYICRGGYAYTKLLQDNQNQIKTSVHKGALRIYQLDQYELWSDFLEYAEAPERATMQIGKDGRRKAQSTHLVAAYRRMIDWKTKMQAWKTRNRQTLRIDLARDSDESDEEEDDLFDTKPYDASDGVNICNLYLKSDTNWFIQCDVGMGNRALQGVSSKNAAAFDEVMEWIRVELDRSYAFEYVNKDVQFRALYWNNMGVRMVIEELKKEAARERMEGAGTLITVGPNGVELDSESQSSGATDGDAEIGSRRIYNSDDSEHVDRLELSDFSSSDED